MVVLSSFQFVDLSEHFLELAVCSEGHGARERDTHERRGSSFPESKKAFVSDNVSDDCVRTDGFDG